MKRDFRKIALAIGSLGFILMLGAAGASDCGNSFDSVLPKVLIGLAMMLISFVYIYWYEEIKN